MKTNKLLIYGANGYTGRLICEEAARKGLKPILAGRSKEAIVPLAEKYGWECRIFSLENINEIGSHLSGIDLVLHCAGPFRFTAKLMLESCLKSGIHYLDITGEIEVFALAQSLHQQALDKNIMLLPGTGFDVVPTDCLALRLKEKMLDATSLELAFVTLGGQISHGTASSMIAKLGEGGASRINGRLRKEPVGKNAKTLHLDGKQFLVMSIPWGDVFTAFYSTGIENIRAYTGISPLVFKFLKLQSLFNPILRTRWFRRWMQQKVDARPAGPTDEKRSIAKSYIWGEVTNPAGNKISDWYTCPEGYTLTATASVAIAIKVMNGYWKPGYQTPAGCYGSGLIDELC
jgi:short subunit dehydrogenase-like uncharacterized protein